MERKLYFGIMTPSAVLTIVFGLWLWLGYGITGGWLHAKLALVALLVAFHVYLGVLLRRLRARPQPPRPRVLSLAERDSRAADPRRRRVPRRGEAVLNARDSHADDASASSRPARAGSRRSLAAELARARRRRHRAHRRRRRRSPATSRSPTARTSNRGSRAASCGASAAAPTATSATLYALVHGDRLDAPVRADAHAARRRRRDALAAARASNSRRCASRTPCATAFAPTRGVRPSVDKRAPDVRVSAYLTDREATIYVDTSGEPLFKRGYRRDADEAPLRENLAAGLLALAGWTPGDAVARSDVRQRHDRRRGGADRGRPRAGPRAHVRLPEARVVRRPGVAAHQAGGARPHARRAGRAADLRERHRRTAPSARRGANLRAAQVGGFVASSAPTSSTRGAPARRGMLLANPPYGVRLADQRTSSPRSIRGSATR